MIRPSLVVVALAATLAVAAPASADIGVVVNGAPTLLPDVVSHLEAWLRDRGYAVRPTPLEPAAAGQLLDCFRVQDLSCAGKLIDRSATTQTVVFVQIDVASGSHDVSLSGWWLAKGHEAIAERRDCKHCTDTKAILASADELMTALSAQPPTSASPIAGPAGPASSAAIPVQQLPAQPETSWLDNKPLAYGVIAGGGVVLAAGVVIAIVGKNEPPMTDTTDRYYTDYRPIGYVAAPVGAVVLAGGLYMLLHPHATSAPIATAVHGGATFGWTGRF